MFPKELHRRGMHIEMQKGEELWSVAFKVQYAGEFFEFFSIVVEEYVSRADDEAMGLSDISAHMVLLLRGESQLLAADLKEFGWKERHQFQALHASGV